ncbi:MAG: hypothetical protein IKR32_05125 [Bacteroidales bacterium]|nr:hypothetical protein [Bacteroidales bacterium]
MNYNYVVFNNYDPGFRNREEDGYYAVCLADLAGTEGVQVVTEPFRHLGKLPGYAMRHLRADRYKGLLTESFWRRWYPRYFRFRFDGKDRPLCFLLIANPPVEYLRYLKERYPGCRIVKFFRDLVATKQVWYDAYREAGVIDEWITIDAAEAQAYGMHHYPEIESRIDLAPAGGTDCDVFFAGKAKDRAGRLLAIYDALEAQGIRCRFYLTETPPAEQVARPGIVYAAKPLTYREMLERNLRARCILEMNQRNAVGYTSRFLEAVMYDRRLLTDNPGVADSPFYDPRWIRIYRGPADIDPAFIRDPASPDFRYAGEFSPRGLIDFIDRELLTA